MMTHTNPYVREFLKSYFLSVWIQRIVLYNIQMPLLFIAKKLFPYITDPLDINVHACFTS